MTHIHSRLFALEHVSFIRYYKLHANFDPTGNVKKFIDVIDKVHFRRHVHNQFSLSTLKDDFIFDINSIKPTIDAMVIDAIAPPQPKVT